jgi:hypothetical protein
MSGFPWAQDERESCVVGDLQFSVLRVVGHDLHPVIKFQVFDTLEMFCIVRHQRQPMHESASGNKHVCVIYDQPGAFK